MLGGPLGFSLAPVLKSKFPGIAKALKPLANFYVNAAGYRKMGLKYDDLIVEERPDVQKALSRLTPRESYDRIFRHRVAIQQSILHRPLPKDQWTKPEDDVRYLKHHIEDVVKEDEERLLWDTISLEKKKNH